MTQRRNKNENIMNKKLFTQIKNEWQSNLWLAIELLLVSVVMWYIVDYLYVRLTVYNEPRGFDTEHCYLVEMGCLTDKSPAFDPQRDAEQKNEDVQELAERLRRRPDIEAVSLSLISYPYNSSNGTTALQMEGDTLRYDGWLIRSIVSPDFVRVFRYHGVNGETPEQLAEKLNRGELLVSDNVFEAKYDRRMSEFVGRRFHVQGDTTRSYPLGASLQVVRYHDYQSARNSFRVLWSQNWWDEHSELCIRVRPEHDGGDFIERLKADSESQFRVGNIFISNVRSFEDVRESFQQSYSNMNRNYYAIMGFLLVNVFLGLLGTFWFRTQQRRCEIALHKAHGSSDWGIFSRLVSEGLLLLLMVTPIALLLAFNITHAELNIRLDGDFFSPSRFFLCAALSWALIALMIAVGIAIPARRAMKIQPAAALHDE